MRTLYLHIGQRQTGDEGIRSCFARNRVALARAGVRYPRDLHPRDGSPEAAERALRRRFGTMLGRWSLARELGGEDHILLSSSALSDLLEQEGFALRLSRFAKAAGFTRIKALMMIRDPIEHLTALYLDHVGRRGGVTRLDTAARAFDQPSRALMMLERCAANAIELTILNRSRMRGDELTDIASWLEIDPDVLFPPHPSAARSLTGVEAAFQRALNAKSGAANMLLADDIQGRPLHASTCAPQLSAEDRSALIERVRPAMEAVNNRVGPAHAYRFETGATAPDANGDLHISRADLRRIAQTLAQNMRP